MKKPTVIGNRVSPHVRALVFALAEKDIVCKLECSFAKDDPAQYFVTSDSDQGASTDPQLLWNHHHLVGQEECLRFVDTMTDRNPLVPTNNADRERVEEVLDLYYREAVFTLGRNVAAPYLSAIVTGTQVQPLLTERMNDGRETVIKLERHLGSASFFGGQMLSLADIALSSLFEHLCTFREYQALVPSGSSLRSWYQRVSTRSAFDLTRQEGGSIPGLFQAA